MKTLLLITALFASNLFAQDTISNGRLTVDVNGVILQSGDCETFIEGSYEGITTVFAGSIFTTTEILVKDSTVDANGILTVKTNTESQVSADGLCISQNYLSALEVIYTRAKDEVKFEYNFRCNRKAMKKTILCSRQ